MSESQSRLAVIIDSTGAEKNADNLTTALGRMTQAGEKAAAGAKKVTKATDDEKQALTELLDRIDPVNAALNKLDKQQQELGKYKAKGFIDTDTFDLYSTKIEETRNRLNAFGVQSEKTGMSQKQLAASMRLVPAQMTDIVVSLAAGQAPLTVLLQQGGQLKDMFGGIVPAAKALGTYVAGLVNPFTLAAGAVGLLTYAVYSNRQELDAATKLAQSSLGATGENAEKLAMNMLAISDNTGKAVDEVANMFITTNDGASQAISKLIEVGYGYDDARKMVDAYKGSANFTALNKDIDEHQRKVLNIRDAWTAAAIDVRNYYTAANTGKQDIALGGAIDPSMRFIGQAVDLQKTMNELRIQGNKEVAASVDWINKEYLATDRVAGAEDRLKQARSQAKKIAASGNQEAITQANNLIALREKEVEQAKKAQEPKQKKEKAYTEDSATRLLDQINQQNAALEAQMNETDKLSSATQQRIKFEQQIADLKTKSQLTADQKSLLANADAIDQALRQQEALQTQVSTLDDYRKMQEAIAPKEDRQNETLQKRLDILQKMVSLGKLDPASAGRQASDLVSKSVLPDSVISGVNQAGGTLKSGATGNDLSKQGMNIMGIQIDPQLEIIEKLKQAQIDYGTWLTNQQKTIAQSTVLTEQQKQEQITALQQQGMQNQQMLSTATYAAQLQSAQTSFSGITDSMGTMFGEQSSAYKAAFAVSKAFSIAQASLNLYTAISQVMADPTALTLPQKLANYGIIAASMASIVSGITSVAATGFEKGGYTGGMGTKSVAGVVHGQEYVFDAAATRRIGVSNLEAIRNGNLDATLSKPGFGTGNNSVSSSGGNSQTNHISQVINMPQNAGITQQEMDSVLKQNNKQLVTELSNQTLEGKGQFGKSLRAAQGRGNRMT